MKWKSICLAAMLSVGAVAISRADDAPAKPAGKTPATKPATTKPPAKPRTPDDAITPAVHSPARDPKFLEEIKKGPYDLLFIGDSITDYWPKRGPESWAKLAEYKPLNLGVSGDRTEHVLWRLDHGELNGLTPKVTVIMIGTNNVGMDKPEWVAAGVTKIVETVRAKLPDTKILLLAIFPRATVDSKPRLQNQATNDIVRKLADDKHIFYLDIGDKFLDEKGNLTKEIMPDFLHPSAKGYDIWYDAMKPKLDEMMK